MKCSEGVSNRVFIIIRSYEVCCLYGCLVYHILPYSFGSILYHCIYGCVFLFNLANYVFLLLCLCILIVMFMYSYCYVYVFLLLCMFRSVCSVSLCRSVYCLCVNVYCTAATR